jgi:chromate transporter
MCVEERGWLSEHEFEDAIATTNLLPGPASTQLAIFCAWRLRGRLGALVGGLCFILPGLVMILALAVLFFAAHTPLWVRGAALGAGAAVPAVALNAALRLVGPSWRRSNEVKSRQVRWLIYFGVGVAGAVVAGSYLVLALIFCGLVEISIGGVASRRALALFPAAVAPVALGGLLALSWVAFKVGALSYGGGFVIIPLMQHDVVTTYHWMSGAQFLSAVALGQITPGPVVQTVAVVGYAASGLAGGLLASFVAFAPSFLFVMVGAPHFDRLRASVSIRAFLLGAGAAVIGAIAGSAVPLGRELLHLWQFGVLGAAALWLFAFRRGVVSVLVGAGFLGVIAVLAGAPH